MNIKTITVIGANGTMGKNVSGIFASFGNAKVYMVGRNIEDVIDAKQKAINSVKSSAIDANLIPKDYSSLEQCIKESDLIFESVFEDLEVKRDVYNLISKYIRPGTVVATGTSGLSINSLGLSFETEVRKSFLGIHMFNPPYNMTLCEVIPTEFTDKDLLIDIKKYLTEKLKRKVVEVKDQPAFLGNRIGFQFLNEALQLSEKYKQRGGIDYIDSIIGPFTGRSMAPLVTANFVGLDVHKAIVDNIYENTQDYANETFIFPTYSQKLVLENQLGAKTGSGLYKTIREDNGSTIKYVYDIASEEYRRVHKYDFPFVNHMIKDIKTGNYESAFQYLVNDDSEESILCIQLLMKYVIYSIKTTKAIGESIHSADDVMATGFSWIPPLAVIDIFGGVQDFKKLVKTKLSTEYYESNDLEQVLSDIPRSNYDYRPFLKAK